jgi:hypothetical protein
MRLTRTTGALLLTVLLATTVNGVAAEPAPSYHRIRAGLRREPVASRLVVARLPTPATIARARAQSTGKKPQASLWRGAAIGAGIGALIGGFIWAPSICSSNDSECTAITVPVGLLGGAGIGAAAGAVVQALAR